MNKQAHWHITGELKYGFDDHVDMVQRGKMKEGHCIVWININQSHLQLLPIVEIK